MLSPLFCSPLTQAWASDDDDEPPFSPVMRKKAVKVKHVKRREKKFDKKVRLVSAIQFLILLLLFKVLPVSIWWMAVTHMVMSGLLTLVFELSRRSHDATNRNRSTKTEPDTVRKATSGTTVGSVSVWDQAVWKQQDPTPSTALRTVAWS